MNVESSAIKETDALSAEYIENLDRKMNMLFDVLDNDPYFSKFDEADKEEIERELVRDLLDKDWDNSSFLIKTVKKEYKDSKTLEIPASVFRNNPENPIKDFVIDREPIKLPAEEYLQIRGALREDMRNIDSENFSPKGELINRAAFRLAGLKYIKNDDERENFLANLFDEDEDAYGRFADAFEKTNKVYERNKRELTSEPSEQAVTLLASEELYPPIEVPEVPEVPEEEKKPSWFRRHPRLTAAGIISLLGIAGTGIGYAVAVYMPKQQRVDQLVNSGAIADRGRADLFDSRYSNWAINNAYNSTVRSDFIPLWLMNQTLAEAIGAYAVGPNQSVFRIAKIAYNHPEVAVDTPRQWKNLVRLMGSIDNIDEYPILLSGGAVQIDNLLHKRGLAGNDENYAWEEFAIPAVDYIVRMVHSGNFTVDGLNREETGRLLLPIELVEVDIKGGSHWMYQEGLAGEASSALNKGIRNVNPDTDLGGDSPQEWLGKIVYRIYEERGARYRHAIFDGNFTWSGHNWPSSSRAHEAKVKNLLRSGDDIAVFIYGNAGINRHFVGDPPEDRVNPIVTMTEQDLHYYKVLVGRSLGRVVIVYGAPYNNTPAVHEESFVKTKYGDYLGLWTDLNVFIADYSNSSVKPWLRKRAQDGNFFYVDLPQK